MPWLGAFCDVSNGQTSRAGLFWVCDVASQMHVSYSGACFVSGVLQRALPLFHQCMLPSKYAGHGMGSSITAAQMHVARSVCLKRRLAAGSSVSAPAMHAAYLVCFLPQGALTLHHMLRLHFASNDVSLLGALSFLHKCMLRLK